MNERLFVERFFRPRYLFAAVIIVVLLNLALFMNAWFIVNEGRSLDQKRSDVEAFLRGEASRIEKNTSIEKELDQKKNLLQQLGTEQARLDKSIQELKLDEAKNQANKKFNDVLKEKNDEISRTLSAFVSSMEHGREKVTEAASSVRDASSGVNEVKKTLENRKDALEKDLDAAMKTVSSVNTAVAVANTRAADAAQGLSKINSDVQRASDEIRNQQDQSMKAIEGTSRRVFELATPVATAQESLKQVVTAATAAGAAASEVKGINIELESFRKNVASVSMTVGNARTPTAKLVDDLGMISTKLISLDNGKIDSIKTSLDKLEASTSSLLRQVSEGERARSSEALLLKTSVEGLLESLKAQIGTISSSLTAALEDPNRRLSEIRANVEELKKTVDGSIQAAGHVEADSKAVSKAVDGQVIPANPADDKALAVPAVGATLSPVGLH